MFCKTRWHQVGQDFKDYIPNAFNSIHSFELRSSTHVYAGSKVADCCLCQQTDVTFQALFWDRWSALGGLLAVTGALSRCWICSLAALALPFTALHGWVTATALKYRKPSLLFRIYERYFILLAVLITEKKQFNLLLTRLRWPEWYLTSFISVANMSQLVLP